jgi:hypothetical protein
MEQWKQRPLKGGPHPPHVLHRGRTPAIPLTASCDVVASPRPNSHSGPLPLLAPAEVMLSVLGNVPWVDATWKVAPFSAVTGVKVTVTPVKDALISVGAGAAACVAASCPMSSHDPGRGYCDGG